MGRLQAGDIGINFQISGDGETIVFIHGLGSSARDWEFQVDFFSKDYKVLAYDVRGHGDSDKPPGPYSIPQFSKDAQNLIKKLDLAPAHMVGISMGGMIGFQFALDAPDLVKSLVVVNAGPELLVKNLKDLLQVWQRHLLVRVFGMRKVGEVLGVRIFPKESQNEIRSLFVERWAENNPRAWLDAFKGLVGWSVSERLSEIKCPVLVITADQDYTPVSAKEAYTNNIPKGRLAVIEDSHHATPIDQTEKFNQILLSFLKEVHRNDF
jgi:pimeloyl-ACP methyl ester carboxylesterase